MREHYPEVLRFDEDGGVSRNAGASLGKADNGNDGSCVASVVRLDWFAPDMAPFQGGAAQHGIDSRDPVI